MNIKDKVKKNIKKKIWIIVLIELIFFIIILFILCLWKVNYIILRVIFYWNNSVVIFIFFEFILYFSVDNRINRLFNVVRV